MNRTERAELCLGIARRVLQEQQDGRSVDPDRLEWARQVIRGNAPDAKAQDAARTHLEPA